MKNTVFFTSICANYLGKALTLASSVKQRYPNSRFVIGLVERELPSTLDLSRYPMVDQIILAKDLLPQDEFDAWVYRYSVVEASTAIKGLLLSNLYDHFSEVNSFIYLDPDTYVYSPFSELFEYMTESPIVITPHLEVPGNLEMELSALRHGVFNLGFLAVSRSLDTKRFIAWWVARLEHACYDDIANGVFTDQKWINLVPCFFPCRIMRDPGYNFATWSLLDRKLSRDSAGQYIVNGQPLRFAHFSGFDGGMFNKCVERWAAPDDKSLLLEFAEEYTNQCDLHQASVFKSITWSYAMSFAGKRIWKLTRVAWRECFENEINNPFAMSNLAVIARLFTRGRLLALLKKWIRRCV